MKKLVFAAVAALVMASFITSCTKESGKCYKVQYTIPEQEAQYDSTGTVTREAKDPVYYEGYKWMTATEAKSCQSTWASAPLNYTDIKVEEAGDYKTKTACLQATYAD